VREAAREDAACELATVIRHARGPSLGTSTAASSTISKRSVATSSCARRQREENVVARAAIAVEPRRRLSLIAVMPDSDHVSTPTPWEILGWLGLRRVRLDELLDAWRFAAEDARLALAAWRSAPSMSRGDAYHVYRAALDREAKAADVLAHGLALRAT
jgi:hypothetical protein